MKISPKHTDSHMSVQKAVSVLLSFVFFLLILIMPLVFINRVPGKVSPTENRVLASFPAITSTECFNKNFIVEFGRWFNDNLGFRFNLAAINANFKVKLFNQSSGMVNIGKEGWYYYTGDNNIELTTGGYQLTEEHLAELAARQQRIADNYALRGIEYYYVINPSKATIYPEYVYDPKGTTHGISYSPAEIAADYLTAHTTVKAMTPKDALLAAKNQGTQVFLKTDSHYTHIGAYIAACAVGEFMGIPMPEMTGTYEEQCKGEFSNMLGNPNILPPENALVPIVDETYIYIDQNNAEQYGDFYVRLKELAAGFTPSGFSVYENPSAPGGTLLIYGDSQVAAGLGYYFYKYYSQVVILHMTSFTSGSLDIEALVKPNAVIRDLVERYIGNEVSLQPNVGAVLAPDTIEDYVDISIWEQEYYDNHWGGLFIDTPVNDGQNIILTRDLGLLNVTGWSYDPYARRNLNTLYIKGRDGKLIDVWDKYMEHAGPQTVYKDPLLPTNIGFNAQVPLDALENLNELVFVRIGAYGQRLPDKVFSIIYEEVGE
ncbi:MAG TPA: hypothetical protein GX523_09745 [Desulfitobacterium dehalogenans]|uniref:AlgX/AlgJ SGNH hydrolase-like domain-containing protein n=1 Tax=Desulfitobacterium dehalogenans TaxID=36854 RepID=A0A7C6Z4R0_9FIRM|nr:hypothetical protein [Desulfitobacterium dehalogenans]